MEAGAYCFHGSFIRRFLQLSTFIVFAWWAAVIKSLSATLHFLFGPDYKQAIYGKSIRKARFLLDGGIPFTNHGSFGAVPKPVFDAQQQYKEIMEQCPDEWFRHKARDLWDKSLETVAKFVGSDTSNLVFVPNATSGINTVLWSLDIKQGDGILITNQTYNAVQMTAQEVCLDKKAKLVVLNIAFPTSDMPGSVKYYATDVVQHYENVLQENPCVKVAIIDAITSNSALKLPFKKLAEVCHNHGVTVLIDGAHAPGQLPLDLEKLRADFFVGNLHKWAFAPRGCAILYVSPKFHDVVMPRVVSHDHDRSLQDRFFDQGTLDHTPYISSSSAIKFYLELGGMGAITKYNSQLSSWASKMLADEWQTKVLPIPESMRAPCMALARLPRELCAAYGATPEAARQMNFDIYDKYKVIGCFVVIQASLWCRVSAQVYNVQEDYSELARAVLGLRDECMDGFRPEVEKAVAPNRWSWDQEQHKIL